MAKNGIYTRGYISRQADVYTCDLEIYQRKGSKIYHREAVYKGELTTSDVWDLAKKEMKPGEALLTVDILKRDVAIFEMSKPDFYKQAACRLLNKEE